MLNTMDLCPRTSSANGVEIACAAIRFKEYIRLWRFGGTQKTRTAEIGGCELSVESFGFEVGGESGGVIGLDSGGATADGVLPACFVIGRAQAIDVDIEAGFFGEIDDGIEEIPGIEGDHFQFHGVEQSGKLGGAAGFGHDFQLRPERAHLFEKA